MHMDDCMYEIVRSFLVAVLKHVISTCICDKHSSKSKSLYLYRLMRSLQSTMNGGLHSHYAIS